MLETVKIIVRSQRLLVTSSRSSSQWHKRSDSQRSNDTDVVQTADGTGRCCQMAVSGAFENYFTLHYQMTDTHLMASAMITWVSWHQTG